MTPRINWDPNEDKYKYKLAPFEVIAGRAPFEVGAPFLVGEPISTSSWRYVQVQVGGVFEASTPFRGSRTIRLCAQLSSSGQPIFLSQRTFSRRQRTRNL